ncbi:uncharacterized protein LOC112563492 isoform X2 [Pomacea canaliculata]|uniref:uncharacterized protein LOC112563492 isoform X2 n=1 Tax=Pomacea canaliculata TaxID=400727 RepID=UPI000D72FCFE|nr:uncharacterized protein LOC112563492 isoform X2 [Pomacea canaliculata]
MCWPYELAGLSKCCCKSYGGCNNKLWVPYSVVKQWAYIRGLQLQEKQLPSLTTVNKIYLLLIYHQPDIKTCLLPRSFEAIVVKRLTVAQRSLMKWQLGMASMASIAQEFGTSWDGLYHWLKARLEQLNVPESELHLRSIVKIFLMNHKDLEDEETHSERNKVVLPRKKSAFRSSRSIDESRKSVAETYINHLLEKQMQQRSHESSDVKSLINELSLRIGEARERKDVAGQLTIQSCPGNSENGVKNATDRYNQAFPPLSEISIKTQTACSLDTKHSVWYSRTPLTCKPAKETSQKNESSKVTQTAEMSPKNGLLHKRSNRPPCKGKENELLPGKGEQKRKISQSMKKEHVWQTQGRKSVENYKSSVHDHLCCTSYESFCRKAEQDLMSFLYSKPKFSPKHSLQPLGQKEDKSWYAVPVDSLLMLTKSQHRLYRRGECYSHSSPDSPINWPSNQMGNEYNPLSDQADGISLVKQNIPDIGKEHQLRCNNFESEWFERTGELDVKVVPTTTIKASVDEGHGANLYVGMEDDAVFKQLRAASEPTPCSRHMFTHQTSHERSDQTMPSIFADDKTDLVGRYLGITSPYLPTDSASSDEDHSNILVKTDVFEQLDSSCRLNTSGRNGMDVSVHPDDADIESVDGTFLGSDYICNNTKQGFNPCIEVDVAKQHSLSADSGDTLACSVNSASQTFCFSLSPGPNLDHQHLLNSTTSFSSKGSNACIASESNGGLFGFDVLNHALPSFSSPYIVQPVQSSPLTDIIKPVYSEKHQHPFSFSCLGCLNLNYCMWIQRCRGFGGDAMHFWTSCASGCLYIPELGPAITQCVHDHCYTVREMSPDKETWTEPPTVSSISQEKQEQMKFLISVGNIIFSQNPTVLDQAQEKIEDFHSFSIYCKGCVSMTMYEMSVRGQTVEWGEVQSFLSSCISGCFSVEDQMSVCTQNQNQLLRQLSSKTPTAVNSFCSEGTDAVLLSFDSKENVNNQEAHLPRTELLQDGADHQQISQDLHLTSSDPFFVQDVYNASGHTPDKIFSPTKTFHPSPFCLKPFDLNSCDIRIGKESFPVGNRETASSNECSFCAVFQQEPEDSLIAFIRQPEEAATNNNFLHYFPYPAFRHSSQASSGSTRDHSPEVWKDPRMCLPAVENSIPVIHSSDNSQRYGTLDCMISNQDIVEGSNNRVLETGWGAFGEALACPVATFAESESQGSTDVQGCNHSCPASQSCEACTLYIDSLVTGYSSDSLPELSNQKQHSSCHEWKPSVWHTSDKLQSRQHEHLNKSRHVYSPLNCVENQDKQLVPETLYSEMFQWMCTQLQSQNSTADSKQDHNVPKLGSFSHLTPRNTWEKMGCLSHLGSDDVWEKPACFSQSEGTLENPEWSFSPKGQMKNMKSKKCKEADDMLQTNSCNLAHPWQEIYRISSHFHQRCISDSSLVLPSENSAFRACTRAHSTPALTHDSPFSIGAPPEILVGKKHDKSASLPLSVPLDVIVGAKQKINLPVYQKLKERAEARGHHFLPIRDDSKSNSRAAEEEISVAAPGDIFGVPPPIEPPPCRHQYHSSHAKHSCKGACCCPTFFYSGSDKTTQTYENHAGNEQALYNQHGHLDSGDESRLPAFRSICSVEAGEDCEVRPATKKYEEKDWKMLQDVPDEEELLEAILSGRQASYMASLREDNYHHHVASHSLDTGGDQIAVFEFSQESAQSGGLPYPEQAVYLAEVEEELLNSAAELASTRSRRRLCKKPPKGSGYYNKPCSFYLEGQCYRADCKFSHDTSSITCRFWEEGQCFKGDLCPFRHGYLREDTGATRKQRGSDIQFELKKDDFPALTSRNKDIRDHSAPPSRRKKGVRKPVVRHQPRGN